MSAVAGLRHGMAGTACAAHISVLAPPHQRPGPDILPARFGVECVPIHHPHRLDAGRQVFVEQVNRIIETDIVGRVQSGDPGGDGAGDDLVVGGDKKHPAPAVIRGQGGGFAGAMSARERVPAGDQRGRRLHIQIIRRPRTERAAGPAGDAAHPRDEGLRITHRPSTMNRPARSGGPFGHEPR